jgi:AraC-like DNA-binding protein
VFTPPRDGRGGSSGGAHPAPVGLSEDEAFRHYRSPGLTTTSQPAEAALLQRFRRYRALIEREFTRCHGVALYVEALGCSGKSLSRAARAVSNISAKAVLTDRIVLEAKRLLAHSLLPVADIGYEIGFSEPTNVVKFFRRETRLTPGASRRQLRTRIPDGLAKWDRDDSHSDGFMPRPAKRRGSRSSRSFLSLVTPCLITLTGGVC